MSKGILLLLILAFYLVKWIYNAITGSREESEPDTQEAMPERIYTGFDEFDKMLDVHDVPAPVETPLHQKREYKKPVYQPLIPQNEPQVDHQQQSELKSDIEASQKALSDSRAAHYARWRKAVIDAEVLRCPSR